MVIGNGLLSLSVVPHYAALAFGRSRALVLVNLAGGIVSMGCGYLLIQRLGLIGAGMAKIVAGVVFVSLFGVVRRALKAGEENDRGEIRATKSVLDFAQ
jgi:O-antigen/teichoic acid export membrane protein